MDLDRHTVTAPDGTDLRVYEVPSPGAEEAVLHLHGAITHARALFAPAVSGGTDHSWLHATAATGRAAYALDVRGYGESDRLGVYDDPPEANDPPVRAADAVQDVRAAVEFVADRHDVVHLLGVSWGTVTAGTYLAGDHDPVASLVQCGPVYRSPADFDRILESLGLDADLGAWFVEDYETVKARQGGGEVFEAVWDAMVDSNQGLPDRDAYLAQTGAFVDARDSCNDDPPYDAGDIDVPTLVVRGSADRTSLREDALACYDENGAPADRKEYLELAGGGHYVMHGPRRHALYDSVAGFFDRATAAGSGRTG